MLSILLHLLPFTLSSPIQLPLSYDDKDDNDNTLTFHRSTPSNDTSNGIDNSDEEYALWGFYDPYRAGGRCTTAMAWDNGIGEPLNVIISGHSSPSVLTGEGLIEWSRSIRFAPECLGMHRGEFQQAHLGDGNGWIDEQYELRQTYFPIIGTCIESAVGGNHFRAWLQDGPTAASNAWFIAASREKDASKHHKIRDGGYDEGRNLVVDAAVRGGCWRGKCWRSKVTWVEGLLESGKEGINHGIEQDGRIALLTIEQIK